MALIAAEVLAGRLTDPRTVIGDVRWYLTDPHQGRVEYEREHLPGARFVDLDTDLSGAEGPGRHPLPPVDVFCRTLGRMGIGPDHTVVAYDASGGAIAARLWWMLDSIGHRSAFVLDGGYQAWVEAGLPHPIVFAVSRRLRVSEEVLDEKLPGQLYVYAGAISARAIEDRLEASLSAVRG